MCLAAIMGFPACLGGAGEQRHTKSHAISISMLDSTKSYRLDLWYKTTIAHTCLMVCVQCVFCVSIKATAWERWAHNSYYFTVFNRPMYHKVIVTHMCITLNRDGLWKQKLYCCFPCFKNLVLYYWLCSHKFSSCKSQPALLSIAVKRIGYNMP